MTKNHFHARCGLRTDDKTVDCKEIYAKEVSFWKNFRKAGSKTIGHAVV